MESPMATVIKHYPGQLCPTYQGIPPKTLLRDLWVIERKMQSPTLFPAKCRIDYQRGYRSKVTQLQEVYRDLEVPVKLTDFALQVP